jgi:hypothetical protein
MWICSISSDLVAGTAHCFTMVRSRTHVVIFLCLNGTITSEVDAEFQAARQPVPWELKNRFSHPRMKRGRDSSVGIVMGYGLDGPVSIPGRQDFLLHRVQTDSGFHPVSYPMGTGGFFPWSKAAAAWNWPLTWVKKDGAIPSLRNMSSQGQIYPFYRRLKLWQVLGTNCLLSLIQHGTHRKRCVQQLFYCCVCSCCRGIFLPSRCLATIEEYFTKMVSGN